MGLMQPKSYSRRTPIGILILFALIFSMQGCKDKKDTIVPIDPAFSQFIEAFTAGTISKTASIKVKLAENMATTHALGEISDKTLFEFSPSVKGKAVWLDARTIEFNPEKDLEPGQLYKVQFDLGKVTRVPKEYAEFAFNFQTVKPAFDLTFYGLRSTGEKDKMFLTGVLETADFEQAAIVGRTRRGSVRAPTAGR